MMLQCKSAFFQEEEMSVLKLKYHNRVTKSSALSHFDISLQINIPAPYDIGSMWLVIAGNKGYAKLQHEREHLSI